MTNTSTKLTATIINKALATGVRCTLTDTEVHGLQMRIGDTGGRWYLSYKPKGRRPDGRGFSTQSIKIGSMSSHSVAEARRAAAKLKVEVADGLDPAAEKRRRRAAADAERAAATTLAKRLSIM